MADLPLTMKLPSVLSLNEYWRPVPVRGKGGVVLHTTMVPTDKAKAFKEDVGWRVKQYGVREPLKCRLRVHIAIYPHRPLDWEKRVRMDPMRWDDTVQCIDVDNARKVLYDAFNGVLWCDDKQVFADSSERMEPDGEKRVLVTISEYIRERNPQGSLL